MTIDHPPLPTRIVSGGQTGVDRAALDAAIELRIPHGGWCPRGRRAEDGRIADCYRLWETDSWQYRARTEQNVLESDATLILCVGAPAGGTELTRRLALRHDRPLLIVDLACRPRAARVRRWIDHQRVRVLNVAGPRESSRPGIYRRARRFLLRVLAAKT